jgi:2-methylisocitrate lyase-like PEP mutase family enzyme
LIGFGNPAMLAEVPALFVINPFQEPAAMSTQNEKAQVFHSLHKAGDPLVLFNVWDAGSAKAVDTAGAQAIATGSWSVAAANGFADGERVPFDFALANLRRIVAATTLPVTIDLESGYGRTPDDVARTVAAAIEAGAVGCNLEDSFPETGKLRDTSDQVERLARARRIAGDTGVAFFINARTDVFFQGPPMAHDEDMVAEALVRARAYAAAGADGLFVPGLVGEALIASVVRSSPLPVNIMAGQGTPPLARLAELGVARVSHGPGPYIAAMASLQRDAAAAQVR